MRLRKKSFSSSPGRNKKHQKEEDSLVISSPRLISPHENKEKSREEFSVEELLAIRGKKLAPIHVQIQELKVKCDQLSQLADQIERDQRLLAESLNSQNTEESGIE